MFTAGKQFARDLRYRHDLWNEPVCICGFDSGGVAVIGAWSGLLLFVQRKCGVGDAKQGRNERGRALFGDDPRKEKVP
jgi:hypothetical protein